MQGSYFMHFMFYIVMGKTANFTVVTNSVNGTLVFIEIYCKCIN